MSTATETKRALFAALAGVAAGLASPARLELLDLLAQGERSVEDLARDAGLSVANTSKHLQQLRGAGYVSVRRAGRRAFYVLADDDVVDVVHALRVLAEKRCDAVAGLVDDYLHARDALAPVSAQELVRLMRRGEVTVVDVRPPCEFDQGHVAGAINVPLAELATQLDALPRRGEIVAYCRGPWCVLSFEAVARLRAAGRRARRLALGLPEWRRAGLPLAAA